MISIEVRRVHKLTDPKGSARGYVDILLGGQILVKGCRVVKGENGLFASMPQTQNPTNEKWYPVVKIEDSNFYNKVTETILNAYNEGESGTRLKQGDVSGSKPKVNGNIAEPPMEEEMEEGMEEEF